MGVEVTSIADLDTALVQQEIEKLSESLQEDAPQLDLKRGALYDLLLYYGGILGAKNQIEQDRLRRSASLQAIQLDPTLADDDTVDRIAANYRVVRNEGATAVGAVAIVLSELADVAIGAGARFVAGGRGFVTENAYVGRASAAAAVAETDRVIRDRKDGFYEFSFPVVAEEAGEGYQLRSGASLVAESPPPAYVKAYAAEDFVGGLNADDNAALIDRFVYGMSAKTLSTRDNMSATLREKFPAVVSDSIVGFGDAEMKRDRHAIWPGSLGGRVDWYVRTQPLYRRYSVVRTATLVELPGDELSVWQLAFGRDDYPGLYYVQVLPGDPEDYAGAFPQVDDIRGVDLGPLPDNQLIPDITKTDEGEYSRFQSSVIRFRDTLKLATGLTIGDTAEYNVLVYAMEGLDAVQTAVSQRGARHVAGDVLIKAPVPCFLALSFTLTIEIGQSTPDTSSVAAALASFVNSYGFAGRLPASALSDVIHNSLAGRSAVSAIDMFGRIRHPGGRWQVIRSAELLVAPDSPDTMTTGRTVAFFLDPADVNISVVETQLPDV